MWKIELYTHMEVGKRIASNKYSLQDILALLLAVPEPACIPHTWKWRWRLYINVFCTCACLQEVKFDRLGKGHWDRK